MSCLIRHCDADEEELSQGITVEWTMDGLVWKGRVCNEHATIVTGGLGGFSIGPFRPEA